VDWWITLHLVQPILLGFLALAVVVLADGLRGPLVTLSRVGIGAFLIAYSAFDAVAGIAVGYVVRYASGLPANQQVVVGGVLEAVALDPIVGGATFSVLGGAASIAWLVAALPVAVGLARSGSPRPAVALLALGTLVFAISHPAPIGPIGMALFLAGTTLLEFGSYRHAVGSVASAHSRYGTESGRPITATRPEVVRC